MDIEIDQFNVELTSHDPTMAPPSMGAIKVVLNSSYACWKKLYLTYETYRAEKERIAGALADQLEIRFSGFKKQIEAINVTTPITFERYTETWQGFEASVPGAKFRVFLNILLGNGWCRTLPGLKNFNMIGQWAGDIGLTTAAIGGRNVVQHICKSVENTLGLNDTSGKIKYFISFAIHLW